MIPATVKANESHLFDGITVENQDRFSNISSSQTYQLEDLPSFYDAQNDPSLLRELLQQSPPENLIPFDNPQLEPNLPIIEAEIDDVNTIAEGLTAIGEVDPNRKTMIYFHGWTRDGATESLDFPQNTIDGEAELFDFSQKWNDAGYNTFIFRWHRDSYELAAIPLEAEQRIYSRVGERAIREILRLQLSLGQDYDQEVVFVAHSLGTGLLLYADIVLSQVRHPLTPDRIDILDPFVSSSYIYSSNSPLFSHPSLEGNTSAYIKEMLGNHARLRNSLDNVPVSVYSSLIGFYSGYELPVENNPSYRTYYGMWDGVKFIALAEDPTLRNKVFNIIHEFFYTVISSESIDDFVESLIGQHGSVRPYYFSSINIQPRSLENSSFPIILASTPIEILQQMPSLIYQQVEGIDTLEDPADDTFEIIRRKRCDRRVEQFNFVCFNF